MTGGAEVTISVPEGEAIAHKTFNPQMGIEGGISILGTSGIVEPMSMQAMIDTMAIELRQAAAQGHRKLIDPRQLRPGFSHPPRAGRPGRPCGEVCKFHRGCLGPSGGGGL